MGDVEIERMGTFGGDLGDLPDIDFLTVPVEDFFGSYVAELGARGQQEGSDQPAGQDSGNLQSSSVDPSFAVAGLPTFEDQSMVFDDLGLPSMPPVDQPQSNQVGP